MKSNTFHGGVHPPEYKELTEKCAFEVIPSPEEIILPLSQHLGKESVPLVKKGDDVVAGQLVAKAGGFISAPVHSSVSGKVLSLGKEVTPTGFPKDSIVIKRNGTVSTEKVLLPPLNPETITPDEIRTRVAEAGIVGQGGAAFPTSVKLSPPKDKVIDVVILNGCECEPYLTRDYRFMIERPDDLISGLKLIMKALGVNRGVIGIENNKPEAIKLLSAKVINEKGIEVISLKTKYPQGAEKMLIKAVTGKEVPPGKLPMDVGAVIQNIGTALAIHDAIVKGEVLTTAALTVSGKGIKIPKNLVVPVGTPIQHIIDFCGGVTEDAVKIIVGGPMMGVAQFDLHAPVMKATSGILVLTKDEVAENPETPCLRCGQCVGACPLNLMPTKLARYSQLHKYEEAERADITVCMECGTCAFTCPANIPLVQWIRLGKQKVLEMQKERTVNKLFNCHTVDSTIKQCGNLTIEQRY
ncbi:MAG: electron transport complex subunit RsxC [Ignavibacteriaceae bacterium]|nr:electron transport complex subunit RsxC [Ignavibacteriaceae bacterium]